MASIKHVVLKNGEDRWRARYRNPEGRSKEQWFPTLEEAEQFLRHILTDIDRGDYVDPSEGRIAYSRWMKRWLDGLSGKKPKTVASYRELATNLVLPELGRRTVVGIRPSHIKHFMARLKERGLSVSRRRQAFWVISGSLRAAVEEGLIRTNPANAARRDALPKPSKEREPVFLTRAEIQQLAEAVGPDWATLIVTLGLSGLRWGEVAALRRKRIDLLHARLHVVESLSEVDGELHFGTPKSGKDRRVRVPKSLVRLLDRHLAQRVEPDPEALVFTAPGGGPLRLSNFRHRVFNPAVKAIGFDPQPTVHDLRHSAASLLLDRGATLELVREHLGHSTITLTQRYSHTYPTSADEVFKRLDEAEGEPDVWGSVGFDPDEAAGG